MVEAICNELIIRKLEAQNSPLQTIYFGGGTPTILSVLELEKILSVVFEHYKVSPNAEITIEANPDDFFKNTSPKILLSELKSLKINRLSIGVQSFFQEDLTMMNRVHSANQATELLENASSFFENITIDLIYGIPQMSLKRWQQNLEKALSFQIPHISAYALTVEEKTALHQFILSKKYPQLDDNQALTHFQLMISMLENAGFIHYELSNFGKEGFFSKNNTAYWFGKKYMGIGPSAHSFNGNERSWNVSNNIAYIKAISQGVLPSEKEILSKNDRYNELIITRLRTMVGVCIDEVKDFFGLEFQQYMLTQSEKFISEEKLKIENNYLKITNKGKFLSDGIATELLKID